MRRRLILALAVLAIATPTFGGGAYAAEKGKEGDEASNSQDVDIAIVGLPVIIEGRLVYYVFTSVKVILAPNANLSAIRTKEPYFRDALIRAAHRTPFIVPNN